MGRHSPRLSPRHRIAGIALGGITVVTLAAGVWLMSSGGVAEDAPLTEGAAMTFAPSTPSTSVATAPETSMAASTGIPPTTASVTTPPAETAPTAPSTLPTTTLAPLTLEPDGLGVVDLGDDYDTVVAAVTTRLGGTSGDSGWVAARGEFGTCPGTVVRVVRWHSLRLFFSDGPTDVAEEGRHFFYYSQSTVDAEDIVDLATPEGIGIGSTVEELQAAYGARLTIESTISFGVNFVVEPPGQGLLSGTLTSSSSDGTITSIGGGFGCGG